VLEPALRADPAPAVAFYRDLLGWEVEPEADSCWAIRNAGADNGGILASPGPAAWLVYFHVAEADESVRTASELGGTVLEPPVTIGLGRVAVLADPQGPAFGVFEGRTEP
jgi:predicted enzyme related to lactoylglutathione lyase